VTPDIIEDVAKELRLDVVHSPETETDGHNEIDVQRAISALLDLYSASESDAMPPEARSSERK
jgi:hypothetical protein